MQIALVDDELAEVGRQQVGDIHLTARIDRDQMRAIQLFRRDRDEPIDLTRTGAPRDQTASLTDGRNVQPVRRIDEEAARLAERGPLLEERASLIEDGDPPVVTIRDEQSAA